jgi:hypothetical protein
VPRINGVALFCCYEAMLLVVLLCAKAAAQNTPAGAIAETAENLTEPSRRPPSAFKMTLFTDVFSDAMFAHGQYEWIDEGFQLQEAIGSRVFIIGRVYGNQLLFHHSPDTASPEDLFQSPSQTDFHFAEMQAGVRLKLGEQTKLTLLGGGYVGDVEDGSAEVDISSNANLIKGHSVNSLFTYEYTPISGVNSATLEFRTIVGRIGVTDVYAGPGGFIYGAGDIGAPDGGAGAILGTNDDRFAGGVEVQAGWGTLGAYSMISLWKWFAW